MTQLTGAATPGQPGLEQTRAAVSAPPANAAQTQPAQPHDEQAEQNRMAQWIFISLLGGAVVLFLALPRIPAAALSEAVRILVMLTAGALPLILYQSFARGRLQTVFNEFRQNLRRLGYPENAAIYQEKFAETFGRTPNMAPANEHAQEARRFSRLSEVPIYIATLLSVLGWISVFYPASTQNNGQMLMPNSSPVIYGFLGAYVFGLGSLVRQYVTDDLQPRYYASLTNRYLLVYVLSWLITLIVPEVQDGDPQAIANQYLLAAFVVGIFPMEVLRIVVRKGLDIFGSKERGLDEMIPLSQLDGLNAWQEDRLALEGIENLQNMACVNLVDLMLKTRYPVEQLVDWIDQSLLILHARGMVRVYQRCGIRTATDFLDIFQPDDLSAGRRLPSTLDSQAKETRRKNQATLIKTYTEQVGKLRTKDVIPEDVLGLEEVHLQILLENTVIGLINAPNMFHVQYWRQHEYEALPEDVERMRTSADMKLMQGMPEEAIEIYNSTLQRFPNSWTTLFFRGLTHFQMGDYSNAIKDYQRAINDGGPRWENYKIAHIELGRAYRELGDGKLALAGYKKIWEEDPSFKEALMEMAYLQMTRLQDYAAAIENLNLLIQAEFKTAEALSNRGLARFMQWKSGDAATPADALPKALEDLEKSLKQDPSQVATYINLILVQTELKQDLLDTLNRAIGEIEAQRAELQTRQMAQCNRTVRAQMLVDNAYRLRLQRGNLYYNRGEYSLAIEDYQVATRLAADAAAYFNLGMAQQRMYEREGSGAYMAAAIQSFREVVRLKPGLAPAQQALGDLLAADNRLDEAERAYLEAIRVTKDLKEAHGRALARYGLGKVYRGQHRLQNAREQLEKARALTEKGDDAILHTRATYELGRVEADDNKLDKAISLLSNSAVLFEALGQVRESANAYVQLASAQLSNQKPEAAREAYTQADRLLKSIADPDNAEDRKLSEQIKSGLDALPVTSG